MDGSIEAEATRTCKHCRKTKTLSEFKKLVNGRITNTCQACLEGHLRYYQPRTGRRKLKEGKRRWSPPSRYGQPKSPVSESDRQPNFQVGVPKGFRCCPTCREVKPATAEHFYACKGRFVGSCKPCTSAINKRAYADKGSQRTQKNRERQKEYYAANRQRIIERGRIYREANIERVAARQRAYYHEHREEVNARRRAKRAEQRAN